MMNLAFSFVCETYFCSLPFFSVDSYEMGKPVKIGIDVYIYKNSGY